MYRGNRRHQNVWGILVLVLFQVTFHITQADVANVLQDRTSKKSLFERSEAFLDWYNENLWLDDQNSGTSFIQVKAGRKLEQSLGYLTVRTAGDTKTQSEKSNLIVNDNYLFLGAGFDYLNLVKGVRLTAQIGSSFDLSSKINRSGFDFRLGEQSYHEYNINEDLLLEFYTEGLYTHRYKNFIAYAKSTIVYQATQSKILNGTLKTGPILRVAGSFDSEGLHYNRFTESQAGYRIKFLKNNLSLTLEPYYSLGKEFGDKGRSYNRLRIILISGLNF